MFRWVQFSLGGLMSPCWSQGGFRVGFRLGVMVGSGLVFGWFGVCSGECGCVR